MSGPIKHNKTFFMGDYEGLRTRRASTLFFPFRRTLRGQGISLEARQFTIPQPTTQPPTADKPSPAMSFRPRGSARSVEAASRIIHRRMRRERAAITTSPLFPELPIVTRDTAGSITTSAILIRFSGVILTAPPPVWRRAVLPLHGSNEYTKASSLTVQETHIFSPTTVNQFRAAWTFFDDLLIFPTTPTNVTASEFGLQNLNPPGNALGVPQLNVPGLTILGANPFQPGGQRENIYSLADDYSWIHGQHSWKFGFDGRYYRPASRVQQTPNGILTFANLFTNQPGVAATGSAIADFLLGRRIRSGPHNSRKATDR